MLVNLVRDDEQVQFLSDLGDHFKLGLRHDLASRVGGCADDDGLERKVRAVAQLFAAGKKGVLFTDTDSALRDHPDLLREYFGTIIPPEDNKFAALNSAVWSGGSFIYVPKGVKIEFPLQAYFRINAEQMGQFERTLILVDEGAEVH